MLERLCHVLVLSVTFVTLVLFGGAQSAFAVAPGSTCGYPAGPKSGTMTVDINEYKPCSTLQGLAPPGYMWTNLSSMPADSQITNGVHPGYCVDLTGTVLDNPMFGNIVYSVTFWSSQDPNLPSSLKSVQKDGKIYTIPWDKINYLINTYPNESWLNIQAALWDLVHGCQQLPGSFYTCDTLRPAPDYFPFGPSAPYGCQSTNPPIIDIAKVQAMVTDANLHASGFVSKAGEKIASVGQITNCTPSTVCNQYLPYQIIFVPSSCPTCTGSLGDYVWKDLNGNGTQDVGEPGIPGVTVHLTGTDDRGQAIDLTTTTDSSGKYQFSQLCTGDYSIEVESFSLPAGVKPTTPRSSNGDDNQPLDSNDPEGTTVKITTDSSSNLTVDFGYVPECSGSIGDYVWKDLDNNGLQSSGEPAFPGITINLTGTTVYGNPINLSTTTNINGIYSFTGLCQGDYRVSVDATTVPVSFVPTLSTSANGDDGVAGDSNVSTGTSVYLPNDMSANVHVDFGYTPKCSGSIGDYVWKDLNENGQQDSNEPGINGVEVSLSGTNSYGQLVSMKTSTDATGKYTFPGICEGTYTLTVNPSTVLLGFIPTEPLSANGSDLVETDSNDPAGTSVALSGDSAVNDTVDFGYVPFCSGTLGDMVWNDLNGNGLQDDGSSSGINGVEVLLTGTSDYGQPVNLSKLTMNGGLYQFTDLCKGTYTVAVNAGSLPNGAVPTSPLSADGNDMAPQDSNSPFGTTIVFSNDSNSNPTVDFGYYLPAIIGDRVWVDINKNGIQDGGEVGFANVTVTLFDCTSQNQLKVTTTDEAGFYSFSVNPGNYYVLFEAPSHFSFTTKNAIGSTVTNDSNASMNGITDCITVKSGEENLTIDAGLHTATVSATCISITAVQGVAITPVAMTASGGTGAPYTFSASGLPAGITMANDGTISGTPTVSGTFNYTVTITDKDGTVGSIDCSITVAPPVSATCTSITAVHGVAIIPVTMTASGGTGAPYTFSATGLPPGITMANDGTISGTPTVSGTFNYTVTITDKDGTSGSIDCSVTIAPPVSATCVSITAVQGVMITPVTMTASGGTGAPYTFSATGLPPGITMANDGTISGTPTVSGTFNYTMTITDKDGTSGSIDCSVTVAPPVSATCVSITAVQGVAITPVAMTATGGAGGPYTFSATGLPTGIIIAADGTISGTPTVNGTFSYTVTVTDKDGNTGTVNCSVTVNLPVEGTCVLINAVKRIAIAPVTMTASGGVGGPYTFSASGLPADLSMAADGTISGTPTVSGTFNYTVTVTDKDGNVGTVNCSVTVNPPVDATCVMITAVQGVAITPVAMTATGGAGGPYTFSVSGLPVGLSMSADGVISGTPTVSGTFNYTVTITDKAGNIGDVTCSLTVNPPVSATCVMITTVQGMTIAPVIMTASGGAGAPYTFTATGLPGGLNMAPDGTISGTPTVSGTFSYAVTVKDSAGNIGTFNCSVTVNPPVSANCVMITAVQGVAITPVTMTASGGVGGPYTFSATGLPAGLSMAANGTISGTPTVSGTFSYMVTVKDSAGNIGTFNCSVMVNPPVSANCVMITAVQGVPIAPVTMTASGGVGGPYTFSATGLPSGLTISSNGTISGTPTVSGAFSYTVTVKDSAGNTGSFNCTVTVNPPPVCVPCKEGVKQVTLKLDWRTSKGDPNERIRVHADSLSGALLYDSWTDSYPGNGLPVGTSFTFMVPPSAKTFVVTVQGSTVRRETVKATFSAECDLMVDQASVNSYITFKVMDVVLDGELNCPTTSIGDYVWKDLNKDGIQDSNETGVAGVTVKLFTCGGSTPVATTGTDGNGKYLFSNLDPGDYSIQFILPSGYAFSPKDQGLLDTIDSDADTETGSTACTTIMAGENDLTWDAGIYKPTTSTGCTYTIGYWKNHSGFGPQPDVVTPLLPQYLGTPGGRKTISVSTVKIAGDILSQNVYGNSSNGITKLYAQLLAAKLNGKAGADSAIVDGIISAADAFLATRSYSDWSTLNSSQINQVLVWHDALDAYNNGVAGPGHCGSQDVVPCISIDKKISADNKTWIDADTQAAALVRSSLSTVYYKLVVNNCGLVGLSNIEVNDPMLGISGYKVSTLAAGFSAALTYTQIPKLKASNQCSTAGAFENVATASADYQGIAVSASDSAWLACNVTSACIDITKDISVDGGATWKTADTQATAPTVAAPHDAHYRLTVKNCGSSSMSTVTVKDEALGITGYTIGSLSAGASKVLTSKTSGLSQLYDRSACSTSGIFTNTAIVTGFAGTKPVSDSDVAWLVCTSTTSGGCSYTQGYWKTHTIYDGAKKRNNTWDKVGGENQLFFKTGQSWYEVLMTEPSTGNAYYILAHQYIAATLNKLSGTDASVVDFDLKHATQLLDKYDGFPSKMEDITGSVREDFIAVASRLDQYNNGLIGPGHCK